MHYALDNAITNFSQQVSRARLFDCRPLMVPSKLSLETAFVICDAGGTNLHQSPVCRLTSFPYRWHDGYRVQLLLRSHLRQAHS